MVREWPIPFAKPHKAYRRKAPRHVDWRKVGVRCVILGAPWPGYNVRCICLAIVRFWQQRIAKSEERGPCPKLARTPWIPDELGLQDVAH